MKSPFAGKSYHVLEQQREVSMTLSCFVLCCLPCYVLVQLAGSMTHGGRQPLIIKSICKCVDKYPAHPPSLWVVADHRYESEAPSSTCLLFPLPFLNSDCQNFRNSNNNGIRSSEPWSSVLQHGDTPLWRRWQLTGMFSLFNEMGSTSPQVH